MSDLIPEYNQKLQFFFIFFKETPALRFVGTPLPLSPPLSPYPPSARSPPAHVCAIKS